MDDHKFEEFIKSKIGEYEDPDFDQTALDDFHHRMAAVSIKPWYVRNAIVLWVISVLIVFTLINYYIHWTVGNQEYQAMRQEIVALRAENREIKILSDQLKKSVLSQDTFGMTELEKKANTSYTASTEDINKVPEKEELGIQEKNSLFVGLEENLPDALLQQLQQAGFVKRDGKEVYLILSPELVALTAQSMNMDANASATPPIAIIHRDLTVKKPTESKKSKTARLPAKTIRELEKQNQNGIGINIGPTLDISQGDYAVGGGTADVGGGILVEIVLSPSFSIETGTKYMFRNYHIDNADELQSIELPDFDETTVNIEKAKINSHILDIPVNLKYRYPFTSNLYGLAGVGYSSILYLRQNFEYAYTFKTGSWDEDLFLSINEEETEVQFSPGMLNFSLGISRRLRNDHSLELLMYYQQSLGKMGEEEITPNFFGVRSTYWWKIR